MGAYIFFSYLGHLHFLKILFSNPEIMGLKRKLMITGHLLITLCSLYFIIDFADNYNDYYIWEGWAIVYQCSINVLLIILLFFIKRGIWYHLILWSIEGVLVFTFIYQHFVDQENMSEYFQSILTFYQILFLILFCNYGFKLKKAHKQHKFSGIILETPTLMTVNHKVCSVSKIQPRNYKNGIGWYINGKRLKTNDLHIKKGDNTIYDRGTTPCIEPQESYLTKLPWKTCADGITPDV